MDLTGGFLRGDVNKKTKKNQSKIESIESFSNKFWGSKNVIIPPKPIEEVSNIRLYSSLYRAAIVVIILALFGSFTFVRMVQAKSRTDVLITNAKNHLASCVDSIEQNEMGQAFEEIEMAKSDIGQIKINLQSWGQDLTYLSIISPKKSRAVELEQMLDSIGLILEGVSEMKTSLARLISTDEKKEGTLFDFGQNSEYFEQVFDSALIKIQSGKSIAENIDPQIWQEYGGGFETVLSTISEIEKSLLSTKKVVKDDLNWLFGNDGREKNILIIFQNNAELRGGSAGSLGSFGIAKFRQGSLISIDFGENIYKLDKRFKEQGEKIEPPTDLRWVIGDDFWVMKDSGWAVDGVEAMKKIMWFYEKESDHKVDGAMIIDSSAFVELLEYTGPIELPQYQRTITKENFRSEVEYETHKGYFEREGGKEENEPKKILADMMPKFFTRLFEMINGEKEAFELMSIISKSIRSKDILLYFENNRFQKRLEEFNCSGKINFSTGDILHINNSNIEGLKSSLSIMQKVDLNSKITAEKKVYNTLSIDREHFGDDEWPDGLNKNLARIVLPKSAQIIYFTPLQGNFQQFYDQGYKDNQPYWWDSENGLNILGFWINTLPKQVSQVEIEYYFDLDVDMNNDFTYQVRFVKQPGALADEVNYQLSYPEGYEPQNVANFDRFNRLIHFQFTLDQDREFLIKFKKINK